MATPGSARSRSALKHHHVSNPSSQIRVVVRIRPFLHSEIAGSDGENPIPCVSVVDATGEDLRLGKEVSVHIKDQFSSRNECYKLDSFFDHQDDLGRIFHREVNPVIPGIFQGFNATVFAYGATGSGKTYTMEGTDDHPGLIPLALSTVLSTSKSSGSLVEISYYEIYLDRCYDLLEPKGKEIAVLEDKDGHVQLKGLSLVPVHSIEEFKEAFHCGVQRRKVAHTGLNDISSRSHGVLSIVVTNGSVKGKLNLIDLAGNEDNRRTCNEGIRLQESAKINQSLFALSNVIYALNNNEPRVPYRDSKLTRILQDSLGGTSRALMVACLNPGSYPEAVHTVSLAARSRHITNYAGGTGLKQETPKVKVDMEAKLRAWLESKGKTKSVGRMNGAPSPFMGRTPNSMSCSKQPDINKSSAKFKTIDQGIYKASVPRKLFDSAAPVITSSNGKLLKNNLVGNDELSGNWNALDEVDSWEENLHGDSLKCSLFFENELAINELRTQSKWSKDEYACGTLPENKKDAVLVDDLSTTKADDLEGKLLTLDINNHIQVPKDDAVIDKENSGANDTPSNKKNLHTPLRKTAAASPPIRERIQDLQRSLRKVLSPVNSEMTPSKNLNPKEGLCIILLEPNTPKTPMHLTNDAEELQVIGTPLDKFNAHSSTLKESLVKEYLTLLNSASREELLALKGIGQKRADYIFQLREICPEPFKSLSDLEKIGLSSKQVNDIFRRAARGIFA